MGAIIVAMPKHEDSLRMADMVRQSGMPEEVIVCDTGSEVLRRVENMEISLVICTRRVTDMGYEELFNYLPSSVNMLLLTKSADIELFSSNIIVLLMPFKMSDLANSISMLLPSSYRKPVKKKPVRTKEEQETLDEAKTLLMERNNMSEPEAFRYIQKSSMDMGRTLIETARMILTLNSDLF